MPSDSKLQFVTTSELLATTRAYQSEIDINGFESAGEALRSVLLGGKKASDGNSSVGQQPVENMLNGVFSTRLPVCMGESVAATKAFGANERWSKKDYAILVEMGRILPVTFYDNGAWGGHKDDPEADLREHKTPFEGYYWFMNGALLRVGTPDYARVVDANGVLIEEEFSALIQSRLWHLLFAINQQAGREAVKAVITLTGIGAGFFAGEYGGQVEGKLILELEKFLNAHAADLPHIEMIYAGFLEKGNAIQGVENADKTYHVPVTGSKITLRTRVDNKFGDKLLPQQEAPERYLSLSFRERLLVTLKGTRFKLFKGLGSDPFSWEGNEGLRGSWSSDEAQAARGSNLPSAIGLGAGRFYQSDLSKPDSKAFWSNRGETWEQLAENNKQKVTADNVIVVISEEKLCQLFSAAGSYSLKQLREIFDGNINTHGWCDVVTEPQTLYQVLAILKVNQQAILLEKLQDKLNDVISKIEDIAVLEKLLGAVGEKTARATLLAHVTNDLLKALAEKVKTATDGEQLLRYLTDEKRHAVLIP